MSTVAVADPTSSSAFSMNSSRVKDAASPFPRHTDRCFLRSLIKTYTFPQRQKFLQVKATLGYPASVSWWKKGGQHGNMLEISSSDQFYDALGAAACQEKLVLVDFYSVGCRSCKALYPKICQLAAENPNIEILTVNFYDNLAFCRSLNINVLPFFHFYRGSEGRIDAFSCSLSKIDKLRAAVAKYQADSPFLTNKIGSSCSELPKELVLLSSLTSVGAAA
ncbi:hypothetical protein GOP47_0023037 [Adiantum capillus-veneris]|uniref:Thioredoxin domain-containing protein n=1 Tax=Adiantum capillus-veneris TaxID=13818 RepID=A0A9D4Z4V5_ADICA|nr:hypothetical protein GOP47_0023037 [Adiantum capillus-veneris]